MLFCTLGQLFFASGLFSVVVEQQYKLRFYKPVTAKISDGTVERHGWGRHKGYEPKLEYSYLVDGKEYKSNNVVVVDKKRGREEAWQIIGKVELNKPHMAYYNPNNPKKAFLYRELIFWPTWGTLFFLSMSFGSCILYLKYRIQENLPPEAIAVDGQWYKLDSEIGRAAGWGLLLCFIYIMISAFVCWVYFSIANRPYLLVQMIVVATFLIIGMCAAGYYVFIAMRRLCLPSIELMINESNLYTSKLIKLKISIRFKNNIVVHGIAIRLVCMKYRTECEKSGRVIKFHEFKDELKYYGKNICDHREIVAGQSIGFEDEVNIPSGVHINGEDKETDSSYYKWMFVVESVINDKKTQWQFPVRCVQEHKMHARHGKEAPTYDNSVSKWFV
jgi:hypothetical protein